MPPSWRSRNADPRGNARNAAKPRNANTARIRDAVQRGRRREAA